MDSRKMYLLTLEEQERLRLKREEWRVQQEYDKKHEERKLKMIEEYERKRAKDINKQKSMYKRRSKSSSPRQREDSSPRWMFASITMDSRKMYLPTLEEQERLRLKREKWRIQQEYDKKHEERKLKMIEEYERKRAEDINKQKSMYVQKAKQEQ